MKKTAYLCLLMICAFGLPLTGCGGTVSEKGAATEDSVTSPEMQAEIDRMMSQGEGNNNLVSKQVWPPIMILTSNTFDPLRRIFLANKNVGQNTNRCWNTTKPIKDACSAVSLKLSVLS